MIGRTLTMLAAVSSEFAAVTTPTGWRLAGQVTSSLPAVMRRADSWLNEDLDAAESSFVDYAGTYKVQVVGPWTLAGCLELSNGDRSLRDAGAVDDLRGALAQAVRDHLAALRRRLPNATFFVQFDEPLLNRVLEGSVPTPSGFAAYQPVDAAAAVAGLRELAGVVRDDDAIPGVHNCSAHAHLALLRSAGFEFVSMDLALASGLSAQERSTSDQELGELLDAGDLLLAGLSSRQGREPSPEATLAPLTSLLSRLGVPIESVVDQLVLTSTCGFAGMESLANVRAVISELSAAGRALRDERVANDGGDS